MNGAASGVRVLPLPRSGGCRSVRPPVGSFVGMGVVQTHFALWLGPGVPGPSLLWKLGSPLHF